MTQVNREAFLAKLEAVRPGVSSAIITDQSNCVVLSNGYLFGYNEDTFCRTPSGLPPKWEAAVPLAPLRDQLAKWNEPDIKLDLTKSELVIIGKGRQSAGITCERKITLGIDKIKVPKKADWIPAPPDLMDALILVKDCAGSNQDEFALTCVHFAKKYVEASDRYQIARHKVKIGLGEDVVLKKDALDGLVNFDVKKMCLTKNWMHFKIGKDTVHSIKRNMDEYPDLSPYLDVKGKKVIFPKGLAEAADRAEIFSSEDKDNNAVVITLSTNRLRIEGRGTSGWYKKRAKVDYSGPPMSFMVPPALLKEIIERNPECRVGKNRLAVDGNGWSYVTMLKMPNEKKAEPEPEESNE